MAEITTENIKKLREITGAGIMWSDAARKKGSVIVHNAHSIPATT